MRNKEGCRLQEIVNVKVSVNLLKGEKFGFGKTKTRKIKKERTES